MNEGKKEGRIRKKGGKEGGREYKKRPRAQKMKSN